MKNGFTLVELLAIMVLLGVIIVVAVPSFVQSNKTAGDNKKRDLANIVNTACVSYVQLNPDNNAEIENVLNTNGGSVSIRISDLKEKGYLKNNLDVSGDVIATNINGEITCNYSN